VKIVVTGAAGKVGRYVLDELNAAQTGSHEVIAADLTEPSGRDVQFIRADVTRLEECQRALDGAEAVIHLAAIPNPLSHPPEVVMHVNVMGTYNVLEAAARAGVRRVVIASTDSALGFVFRRRDFTPEYLPIDEQHRLKPQDPYGLSKMICEEMCQAYTRGWGMETVCVRICRVIFPDELELNRSLAADPTILAKGLWVYIDARDAARAFRLAAEVPVLEHEAVFAVATDCYGPNATADLLDQFYPSLLNWADQVRGRSSLITGAKAERLLGFRPTHSWRDVV
jgi:UDP-glucose 4-epimerase